jgi:hypothetical protein
MTKLPNVFLLVIVEIVWSLVSGDKSSPTTEVECTSTGDDKGYFGFLLSDAGDDDGRRRYQKRRC